MLSKSQIFYFVTSLFAILAVGLFVWYIFSGLGNSIFSKIAGDINQIGSRIFLASVSSKLNENQQVETIILTEDSGQDELADQDPAAEENLDDFYEAPVEPLNIQNQLDDVQEKLDAISQQVRALVVEKSGKNQLQKPEKEAENEDKNVNDEDQDEDEINDNQYDNQVAASSNNNSGGGGGGGAETYPKILISEVQVAPIEQRFIELYNPNSSSVGLSGWYLQRKTQSADSWGSLVSSTNFGNMTIPSGSYFLISRELAGSNILLDITLSDDNSLVFKNPNGEISDKLGFGNASDPELLASVAPASGQSVGRKVSAGVEEETDNNFNDFELQTPTPRAQNIAYVAPPVGGSNDVFVPLKNILISEVQIAGLTDPKEEFVELYNPNTTDVNLTNWYLQKRISGGSTSYFEKKSLFSGRKISAGSYFLIAREGYFMGLADILVNEALSDNSSLIFSNPNDEISDQVGWLQVADGLSWCSDFTKCTPTPKAQNIAYVEPPPPTDTTAPEVSFSLDAVQTSLDFVINFTITDIAETVTPSGVDSYIFQWQEDGGSWQIDDSVAVSRSPASADFTRDFTGEAGKTYNFQVQAKDSAGNISDWLPLVPATTTVTIPAVPKAVLINEIQIEGENTKDDWVELYNPNDFDVDISQWSIQRSPESGKIYRKNFESGDKILAGGYFLIVRNDANQQLLDLADMTCSVLQLSDESTVYLVKNDEDVSDGNDSDIVDKVGIGEKAFSYEGSPAPVPLKGKSIVRIMGADTGDNSKDFVIIDTPTPKE